MLSAGQAVCNHKKTRCLTMTKVYLWEGAKHGITWIVV